MKNLKIQKRIFLLITSFVILTLVILSIVIYFYFFEYLKEKELEQTVRLSNETKQSLEIILKIVNNATVSLARDENIIEHLKYDPERTNEKEVEAKQQIEMMLQSMVNTHEYLNGVYIIGYNGKLFTSEWGINEKKLRDNYGLNYQHELASQMYFTGTHNANYHFFSDLKVISLVVPVFSNNGAKLGAIVSDVNSMYLEEVIVTSSASRNERVLVINSEREPLFTIPNNINFDSIISEIPEELTRESTSIDKKVFGENSIIASDKINNTDWMIIRIISTEEIYNSINKLSIIFLFILFLLILVSFAASYRLSISFTKPIVELNEKIKQIENGDMNATIKVTRTDELGQLSQSFNTMVKKLNFLINKTVEEEKKKMEVEFKLLQSQINPHFLYNTLDSIKWLAVMQNVRNISEMTTSLIHLLRYNVSGQEVVVSLQDEIKLVENYVNIQKYRYGDIFSVTYDISEEVRSCQVLKFLLQPLVENAIYHGMETKGENGKIIISAYLNEKYLIIKVKDNGPGMETVDVEVIDNKKKVNSGIGLTNIKERIHLYFGVNYGLEIDSKKGRGTTITLHLPNKIKKT